MSETPKKRGRPPKGDKAMTAAERQAARQARLARADVAMMKELALYRAAIREIDAYTNWSSPDNVQHLLGIHDNLKNTRTHHCVQTVIRHLDYHLIKMGRWREDMLSNIPPNFNDHDYAHDALNGLYPRHDQRDYKSR